MGCDIHAYVEYRVKAGTNPDGSRQWHPWGGRFHLDRNYAIFGALAGARRPQPPGFVPPRGFPDDAAYQADGDNWMYVADRDEEGVDTDPLAFLLRACLHDPADEVARQALYDKLHNLYGAAEPDARRPVAATLGYVKPDRAAKWVGSGSSRWRPGRPDYVSHPDWHTHSWLTPGEWEAALKAVPGVTRKTEPEYFALLAAMRSLEASGFEVRCVFWFDN